MGVILFDSHISTEVYYIGGVESDVVETVIVLVVLPCIACGTITEM